MSNKEKSKAITLIIISSLFVVGVLVAAFAFCANELINSKTLIRFFKYLFIIIIFSLANCKIINNPNFHLEKGFPYDTYKFDVPNCISKIEQDKTEMFLEYQRIIDEYNDLTRFTQYIFDGYGHFFSVLFYGALFFSYKMHTQLQGTQTNIYFIILTLIAAVSIQVLTYYIFKFTDHYIHSRTDKDFNCINPDVESKLCQNYGTYASKHSTDAEKHNFFDKLSRINCLLYRIKMHREYKQPIYFKICLILIAILFLI